MVTAEPEVHAAAEGAGLYDLPAGKVAVVSRPGFDRVPRDDVHKRIVGGQPWASETRLSFATRFSTSGSWGQI